MLLVHPTPTHTDPGPDFWQLALVVLLIPLINWCKYSTCIRGGHNSLQLALAVFYLQANVNVVGLSPIVTGDVFVPPTCADSLYLHMWCF